jgi:hypothetical protein
MKLQEPRNLDKAVLKGHGFNSVHLLGTNALGFAHETEIPAQGNSYRSSQR